MWAAYRKLKIVYSVGQSSEKTGSDWMSMQKGPDWVTRVIIEGACGDSRAKTKVQQ